MPQKIFCGKCGFTLYEGEELESPLEVAQRYNGVCPRCGKTLNFDCNNIKILPVE